MKIWRNLPGVEFFYQSIELLFRFFAGNGKGIRGPFKLKKQSDETIYVTFANNPAGVG